MQQVSPADLLVRLWKCRRNYFVQQVSPDLHSGMSYCMRVCRLCRCKSRCKSRCRLGVIHLRRTGPVGGLIAVKTWARLLGGGHGHITPRSHLQAHQRDVGAPVLQPHGAALLFVQGHRRFPALRWRTFSCLSLLDQHIRHAKRIGCNASVAQESLHLQKHSLHLLQRCR